MIRHSIEFVGLVVVMAAYLVISLPLLLVASVVSTALELAGEALTWLLPGGRGAAKG